MKKRVLAVVLSAAMALSLAACGGNSAPAAGDGAAAEAPEAGAAAEGGAEDQDIPSVDLPESLRRDAEQV